MMTLGQSIVSQSHLQLPNWISRDLARFASGEWLWAQWHHWLAVHASRLAMELNAEWFARIKSNPQIEIPALLATANIRVKPFENANALLRDPIDDDPNYSDIIAEAEQAAKEEIGISELQMGDCHRFWRSKKRILKNHYNIQWQSPYELNPNVIFD